MEVSGISADFKTPVRCPKCHKLLTIVQIQVTKVLEWSVDENDKEDEGRFEDNGQGATEVFCYHCSTKIGHYDANDEWGLFPDSTFQTFNSEYGKSAEEGEITFSVVTFICLKFYVLV